VIGWWHIIAYVMGIFSGVGLVLVVSSVIAPRLPNWGGE